MREHLELDRQQRNLDDEQRSARGRDGQNRLRDPDDEDFVCHVHSPLIELIQRSQVAPPANAQQTQYLTLR